MLVEVRPIPVKKWHGKKDNESFTQPKTIEALYDASAGRYATGMTEKEEVEFGKKLGVDLNGSRSPNEEHPFYHSKAGSIKLENRTKFFNTDNPLEAVLVRIMKASKLVANSQRALEQGLYPDATHVIYDESEETAIKASKMQQKQKAYSILEKMTSDDKADIIQILSNKTVKGRSNDFVDVEIESIIETKMADFLKYAQMGRAEVAIRASILLLLQKRILTKEAGAIYYMGELLGIDFENTISWFKDPNNSKMKVVILEKLG